MFIVYFSSVCVCACAWLCVCVCVCVCVIMRVCVYVSACLCVCLSVCLLACLCVCMYVCMGGGGVCACVVVYVPFKNLSIIRRWLRVDCDAIYRSEFAADRRNKCITSKLILAPGQPVLMLSHYAERLSRKRPVPVLTPLVWRGTGIETATLSRTPLWPLDHRTSLFIEVMVRWSGVLRHFLTLLC